MGRACEALPSRSLAYPDLLPAGSVHVSEGGAQGRSAVVATKFTPKAARLSPTASSTAIGISCGSTLVIGGIEERKWFGGRHVGQLGGTRQRRRLDGV